MNKIIYNLQATLLFVNFSKAFDSIHRGKTKQILLAYDLPKETIAAIMMICKNTKVNAHSLDGDTNFFEPFAGVLQGDTLAPYLFIICLDYVLQTLIELMEENGFTLAKKETGNTPHKQLRMQTTLIT